MEITSPPSSCPHCGCVANLYKHSSREQICMDLPIRGKRVGLCIKRQRYRCRECNQTFWERIDDIIDDKRNCTKRLLAYIEKQSLKRTFVSISEEVGMDEKTIRNIFRVYVNHLGETIRFETPQWLGIDEIHIIKPRCVLTNIEEQTLFDILPDRNKETVISYLSRLPNKERKRFILLKRNKELSERDTFILDVWTKNYPSLRIAYELKETFLDIWECPNKQLAILKYCDWKAKIPIEIEPAFNALTKAMNNWEREIFAYFDHRITNAYTESLNSFIRVTNRLGRGYSFEALRAKILFTKGLIKQRKPKHQRRLDGYELREENFPMFKVPLIYVRDQEERKYLGIDLPALIEKLEKGQ
ncbi:transposase [Paenibacillus sp. FSL M7-1455]